MKKLQIVLLLVFAWGVSGQEGIPVYFDYLTDNYYLVYPSMAGVGKGGKLRLTARKQWFDVERAPNLQTLNVHFRAGEHSGVGAILLNDSNGFHSQTGLKGTYAHHLRLGGDFRSLNQLSFGLSVGAILSSLDETEFRSVVPDLVVSGVKNTVSYFNIDIGVSYSYHEFFAHGAILNILGTGRDLYSVAEFDNLRRYLVTVGYVLGKSNLRFEPSVLFQATDFTQEHTIDINAKVYKDLNEKTTLWGGFSYRRSFDGSEFVQNGSSDVQHLQLFTPIVGVNIKRFIVSYNYSYQSGDIRLSNGGFHQITLGFDFGEASEDQFDCYCPAANY